MKANRKFIEDRAEVGIGTLIVFIAMVLVAAVAAAVLINTSGSLQQRAQSTGEGATRQAAENLKVTGVEGQTNATKTHMALFNVYLTLAAGAEPIDLAKMNVRWSAGSRESQDLTQSTSASDLSAASPTYKTQIVRMITNSAATGTVLYPGEIVKVTIGADADGANSKYKRVQLAPRSDASIVFVPEFGNPVPLQFSTPNIYNQVYLQIR